MTRFLLELTSGILLSLAAYGMGQLGCVVLEWCFR